VQSERRVGAFVGARAGSGTFPECRRWPKTALSSHKERPLGRGVLGETQEPLTHKYGSLPYTLSRRLLEKPDGWFLPTKTIRSSRRLEWLYQISRSSVKGSETLVIRIAVAQFPTDRLPSASSPRISVINLNLTP
jgi:hypothetical protein